MFKKILLVVIVAFVFSLNSKAFAVAISSPCEIGGGTLSAGVCSGGTFKPKLWFDANDTSTLTKTTQTTYTAGTVTINSAKPTLVTGTSTSFLGNVTPGDVITVTTTSGSESRTIGDSSYYAGTVSVSGTSVTGVGTSFSKYVDTSDSITVTTPSGTQAKGISSVNSDTSITTTTAFAGTAPAGTSYLVTKPVMSATILFVTQPFSGTATNATYSITRGDLVSRWGDKSGLGNNASDLTPGVSTDRPVFGTNYLNSESVLPAVEFNTAFKFLDIGSVGSFDFLQESPSRFSLFVVGKQPQTTSGRTYLTNIAGYNVGGMNSTSGSSIVTAPAANFITAGIVSGDILIFSGQTRVIATVNSATQLTVTSPFTVTASAGYLIRSAYGSEFNCTNGRCKYSTYDGITSNTNGSGVATATVPFTQTMISEQTGGNTTRVIKAKTNNSIVTTGTISSFVSKPSTARLKIGSGMSAGNGQMAISEMILFDKVLTCDQANKVEEYLANKWSISISSVGKRDCYRPAILQENPVVATVINSSSPVQDIDVKFYIKNNDSFSTADISSGTSTAYVCYSNSSYSTITTNSVFNATATDAINFGDTVGLHEMWCKITISTDGIYSPSISVGDTVDSVFVNTQLSSFQIIRDLVAPTIISTSVAGTTSNPSIGVTITDSSVMDIDVLASTPSSPATTPSYGTCDATAFPGTPVYQEVDVSSGLYSFSYSASETDKNYICFRVKDIANNIVYREVVFYPAINIDPDSITISTSAIGINAGEDNNVTIEAFGGATVDTNDPNNITITDSIGGEARLVCPENTSTVVTNCALSLPVNASAGKHEIVITATDTANATGSTFLSLYIDDTPPLIDSVSTSVPGATTDITSATWTVDVKNRRLAPYTLSFNISDDYDLNTATLAGGDIGTLNCASIATANLSAVSDVCTFTILNTEFTTYTMTLTDRAGNVTTKDIQIVDSQMPTMTSLVATSTAGTLLKEHDSVTFTATFDEVVSGSFQITLASGDTVTLDCSGTINCTGTYTVSLNDDMNPLALYAANPVVSGGSVSDTASPANVLISNSIATSSAITSFTSNLVIDAVPPLAPLLTSSLPPITAINQEAYVVASTSITSCEIDAIVTVTIGGVTQTGVCNSAGSGLVSNLTFDLSNSSVTDPVSVSVIQTDGAGNPSPAAVATLSKDTSAPILLSVTVSPSSSAPNVPVTVVMTWDDTISGSINVTLSDGVILTFTCSGATCVATYLPKTTDLKQIISFSGVSISDEVGNAASAPFGITLPYSLNLSIKQQKKTIIGTIVDASNKNNSSVNELSLTKESLLGGGVKCKTSLLLTQNLKAGARNGVYNSYTKAVVREAHILQNHMNRLGFGSGKEDGIIGPITTGAIKRMQAYLGTYQDGYVGPITRGLINNSCKE